MGLIPVIFVALFRVFAANSWAGVYTRRDYCPARLTEGVVVKSRRVDLIR